MDLKQQILHYYRVDELSLREIARRTETDRKTVTRLINAYEQAIKEAEAYDGPSLIIAYAPCINHGLKAGMGLSQKEEKLAVECGYWHLYRYNPMLEGTEKNPFSLDSKEPDWSKFQDFLKGEVRFASLYKMFPDCAEELLQKTEEFAKIRLETYKRLANK